MASLALSTGAKDDEWYTPQYAFADIAHLIPKDKVIWEPFYGDGASGRYLTDLGFRVEHHENLDFFESAPYDYDIIVSNPPYSNNILTFKRLRELDVPFMILVPVSTITKQFTKKYFLNDLQMVIPSKRIHFTRGGEQSKRSWFDVVWLCYKMEFPRDIIYL